MDDQILSCVPNSIREDHVELIRRLIEVKISDQQLGAANFADGIQVDVRCEKPFIVNAFWLVKIQDLHLDIAKEWKTMRDELWNSEFLTGNDKSKYQNKPQIYLQSNEQVQCEIKPPQPIDTTAMTVVPRDFYPLVIIVTCHEEDKDAPPTAAAASILIIHIKDTIVPIKSHVIKEYIKQIDGRILDISPQFHENQEASACFICFEEANPDERLQLFTLLPCRHSPICSNCIRRIRECPKCRCPIASVFDIFAPFHRLTATGETPTASGSTVDPNVRHLYDDADDQNGVRRHKGGFMASIKSLFGF